METNYFETSRMRNQKIRMLSRLLQMTGFVDVDPLKEKINDKIARIEKRKGDLEQPQVEKIVENLILAKVVKRVIEKRLKPFEPKIEKQSPTHHFKANFPGRTFTYEMSAGPIYKEKHYRLQTNPSILFPGFLPDGNEAFFLLRKSFLKFGSVYYLNYPTQHFYKDSIFHKLYDTIVEINRAKLKNAGQRCSPFLVGTSFGCHMIVSFLDWLKERNLLDTLSIRGMILISPVLCLDDIVDPTAKRQKTLVGRAVSHMISVEDGDMEGASAAMQKAKSIFVKMFTTGRDLMKFESKDLVPIFAIEDEVMRVFSKDRTDDDGYFNRFLALKNEHPIEAKFKTDIPTLVLFAEGESDVLTANSPTLKSLSDVDTLQKILPNGQVEIVYGGNTGRKVTHSDLIFQARRFKEHLEPWLGRMALNRAVP